MTERKFGTNCIHAGQPPDPSTGAVIPAISLSTTFLQRTPGETKGFDYSRSGNPTRNQYEALIASLEGGKHGLAFSSGSAATATIMSLFKAGDHIISIDDVYGGTQRFFRRISTPQSGLNYSFIDTADEKSLEAAFTDKTKLVWIESPTNPTLKVTDMEKVTKIAHAHNAIVVVDNTFMSPYNQNPLAFGADLVVHSVTKYINGHSDVVGGVIVTNDDDLHTRLRFLQNGIGAVPSPFDCFMVMRGVKTLHVRLKEHNKNAMALAKYLEASDKVEKVAYPGLPSHPQHEIAKKQQKGFGGMVTIWLKGGIDQARAFLERLEVFSLAESLGGVESLIEHPATMTHASVPAEERVKLGISDTLIRLSVGIEDEEDLIADVKNALDAVKL